MDNVKICEFIGYFLKRKDICNIAVVDILRELSNHLFEANIMKLAIQAVLCKQMVFLDSSVGDWKCQTRTSMIVDLMYDSSLLSDQHLLDELLKINKLILNIEQALDNLNRLSSMERHYLSRQELPNLSLKAYFKKYQLLYDPSEKIIFYSLCFLTTLKNNEFFVLTKHQMSVNKFKEIINIAKAALCQLSINHERYLASKYGLTDVQKALVQIEIKNIQQMTALFVSFKSIFNKMKYLNQSFMTKTFMFCQCGGIQKICNKLFVSQNNTFIETLISCDLGQVVTTIEVYQFPDSMEQLQAILGVPESEIDVPREFYKSCQCTYPVSQQKVESIEQAIMAFFAQHPQFTNGAQIDFEGLGLSNSELKKEYDYLLRLQGFNRHNMSKFHINHIYPATIEQVLQEQQFIHAHLKQSRQS